MVKKNRLTTYFLILVFLGPITLAHLLYYFRDKIHFKTLETGTLIQPIASETLSFYNPQCLGKWQLINIVPDPCDINCQNFSLTLNQIYLALGKEKSRVLKRTISSQECPLEFVNSQLLIIDPKGWLIMHYPATVKPKGILEDIRRLLRFSHVG